MEHTLKWVEKHCKPFVTYDDEFQIWKHLEKEEYWAYDVDEEKFVPVKLIARETFSESVDVFDIMEKYDNDWCGEVDNSYRFKDEDCQDEGAGDTVFDYAWFSIIEEE